MTKPEFGRTRIRATTRTGPVEGVFVEERTVLVRRGFASEAKIRHYRITDGQGTFWLVPASQATILERGQDDSLRLKPGDFGPFLELLNQVRKFLAVAGQDGEAPTRALEELMERGKVALEAYGDLLGPAT